MAGRLCALPPTGEYWAVFAAVTAIVATFSLTGCEPAVGLYQPAITWRTSTALGLPYRRGRLRAGVRLPAQGPSHITWDPALDRSPNRHWRRWGTDRLVRMTLCVADDYRRAHPEAPRLVIGDMSRPYGGPFGRRFGGLGHSSHQNGMDVDVYYPRFDELETAPLDAGDIDTERAQDLVDRFAAAGATAIYVGPGTGLRNPPGRRTIVRVLRNHDDHMHVRIARRAPARPLLRDPPRTSPPA